MDALIARLEEVREKAEYLDQKSRILVEENQKLKRRITELEAALVSIKQSSAPLTEASDAGNDAAAGSLENNEALKVKINEYIREIDQCLRLIGD